MLTWEEIQTGFETFLTLLGEDDRMQTEFTGSRGEFFSEEQSALTAGAELRHLEWFLLERPSAVLGAIPVQAWQTVWRERFPGATAELGLSLLNSLPGAFEVTGSLPAGGLWVRDLFTQGEHPVAGVSTLRRVAPGDLLVGRLFPAGGEVFRLSPAIAAFRNPALLEAVRADLARMRAARRGMLRVQQLELERLFHGVGAASSLLPRLAEVRARARSAMEDLGLPDALAASVLDRVRAAARTFDGREITEVLNRLAFDSRIDLTAARLVLIELWEQERRSLASSDLAEGDRPAGDARAALAAFDLGRSKGKDLEQLFVELERALGVEEDEEAGEEELGAPDFPGVVAAMVTEFLWEVERESGTEQALAWRDLERLGTYASDIGVFEHLGDAHLLDFSTRWILDESGMTRPEEVGRLLEALAAFCRWSEEQQGLALSRRFGDTLERLRVSMPRHLSLRTSLQAGHGTGAYRVEAIASSTASLRDRSGRERALALSEEQAALLRAGDLVRLARTPAGHTLGAGYPAEIASLIFGSDP